MTMMMNKRIAGFILGGSVLALLTFLPATPALRAGTIPPGTIPPSPTSNGTIPAGPTNTPTRDPLVTPTGTVIPFPPQPPVTATPTNTPVVITPTLGSVLHLPLVAGGAGSTMELKGLQPIPEPGEAPLAPCAARTIHVPSSMLVGVVSSAVAQYDGPPPGVQSCTFGGFFATVSSPVSFAPASGDRQPVGYYRSSPDNWVSCNPSGSGYSCPSVNLDSGEYAILIVTMRGDAVGTGNSTVTSSGATVWDRDIPVLARRPVWLPFVGGD